MKTYDVAPAGTPIGLADLAGCALDRAGRARALEDFRSSICRRYRVRFCFMVSTGRAAFALALQALRGIDASERDEVVVPSYTCHSVPASVARAGLKVRVCDVDPATLDYDYRALERTDFGRVLCIASANLYGIPNDLPRIRAIAAAHHAFVLDDAAQSMGATIGGRHSGTLGDVGIFSLDKGKNITTIEGGIIVTDREDLGAAIGSAVAKLPLAPVRARALNLAKLLAYSAFLHPRMYWIPRGIPFLGLGSTPYPREIAMTAYPDTMAGLGNRLFQRIDAINATRIANARYYRDRLEGVAGVSLVSPPPGADPVYVRFPLLVRSDRRARVVEALNDVGIGATASFPTSVADIPDMPAGLLAGEPASEAGRWVAAHIVTLPTHGFVSPKVRERAIDLVSAAIVQ